MKDDDPIRDRWFERPPPGDASRRGDETEDRAASLMRLVEPLAPLSAVALARVRARLGGKRPSRRMPAWQLALVTCLALCIAGVVAAASGVLPWLRRAEGPTVTAPLAAPAPPIRRTSSGQPLPPPVITDSPAPADVIAHAPAAIPPAALPAARPTAISAPRALPAESPRKLTIASAGEPTKATSPASVPGQGPAPLPVDDRDEPTPTEAPARSTASPAATPPLSSARPAIPSGVEGAAAPRPIVAAPAPKPTPAASADTSLAAESGVLASALRKLRQQRDAEGALRVLDDYRARFPRGTLAPEAEIARVDALLALGRRAPALAVLDGTALALLPRARELRVLRGELRASAGRCPDAIEDFSAALRELPGDEIEERALYGRGSCRSRAGDPAGARGDLERYASRFPEGKFARQVRQSLAKP